MPSEREGYPSYNTLLNNNINDFSDIHTTMKEFSICTKIYFFLITVDKLSNSEYNKKGIYYNITNS